MKTWKSMAIGAGLSLGLTASAATNRVETTLSAGASLTDGNSKTQQGNVSLVTEGERDKLGSFKVGIEGHYGESKKDDVKETTINNIKGFANVKKTLSEKTFAFFDLTLNHDEIADLKYRLAAGPGVGLFFVKSDSAKLSLETGPSFVTEEKTDIKDEYVALRVSQNGEIRFANKSKLWESVEYLPRIDHLDRYLLNSEIGLEAALNDHLNLRLVLQDKYDSNPAVEMENNDLSLIAGVRWKI